MNIHLNPEDIKHIDSQTIQAKILAAIAQNIKELAAPGILKSGINIKIEPDEEPEQTGVLSEHLLRAIRELNPDRI